MSAAKILIIEDDLQVRSMLERYLAGLGYRVVCAGDGIEGIRVFSAEHPDLVLLDMLLPKLLGTDVCDMMKRSVEGAAIPIIMMSAVMKGDPSQADLRGKRRADAHLVKPFQFTEMARVVEALLDGRKVDEEPLDDGLEVLEIIDHGGSSVYSLADAGLFDTSKAYAPFAAIVGEGSAARSSPPVRVAGTAAAPASAPVAPLPPAASDDLDIEIELGSNAPTEAARAAAPPPRSPATPPRPATAAAGRAPRPPPPPARVPVSAPLAERSLAGTPAPDPRAHAPAMSPAAQTPSHAEPAGPAAASAERAPRGEGAHSPRVLVMQMPDEAGGVEAGSEFDDLLEDVRRVLGDEAHHDELAHDEEMVIVDGGAEADAAAQVIDLAGIASASTAHALVSEPARAVAVQGAGARAASGGAILNFPTSAAPLPGPPASIEERGLGRITPKVPGPGLRETTVPELLVLLFRRMFSGIVRLEHEGGRKEVYFLNGYPVHVASDLRAESVGRQLVRMGRITEDIYLQSLKVMEEKRATAAEVLVEMGAISAHELSPILRALERENLLRAFGWDGATYELERGAERVARVPIYEMSTTALVAAGLTDWMTPRQLERELGPMGTSFIRATADYAKHQSEVAPFLPEISFEPMLDGTRSVQDLLVAGEAAGYDATTMWLAVKTMRVLGMIELLEGAPSSSQAARPDVGSRRRGADAAMAGVASAPTDGPADAEERALEERVLRTYLAMKRQNYFELLEVPMGARPDEVERAYAACAKAFHPDLIQYVADSDVRSKAKEIYLMLGQAYEVLRDPARRATYIDSLGREPSPAPAEGTAVAEQEFRKGERFLQQGQWPNAQVAFTNALRLNAKEPEYYLMLGWAMYQNYRTSGNEAAINRAVGFIRKAIVMSPQDDRAFFFLGSVYRDRAQADLARQLFQRALKYNPQNREAREALESLG
jgi:CheY-like chemotaxis protein/curved DNA-binding protein CbpA